MTCPGCGSPVRLPAHLTYIDMRRGQWILVEDVADMARWREVEAEARNLYDLSFGAKAPPVQREMGEGIVARLVFGWAALREKLIAQEAGLDDVALELTKIAALRSVPGAPIGDDADLRLVEANEETLTLHWLDDRTELPSLELPVARSVYDGVVADAAGWAALRAELQAGLFVDMKRLFVGAAGAAA
jgi:hypothetical protein